MTVVVGMRGPYAALALTFTAPAGVDFTVTAPAIATCVLSREAESFSIDEADVTWGGVTATIATATYSPDGTEFTSAGGWTVDATLTIAGQPADYRTVRVRVEDM